MSTIFKSELYSTYSDSTIANKKKEVSNSNQETISVIFTHPYPNPSALQNIVWLIWPNRKIIVVGDNKELTLFKRFISKLKNWPLNS